MLGDYLRLKEKEWESMCSRCGGCCGAFDDPCKHLKKDQNRLYFCEIYPNRIGTRKTKAGKIFNCVPVKEILDSSWKNDYLCAYKNHFTRVWISSCKF